MRVSNAETAKSKADTSIERLMAELKQLREQLEQVCGCVACMHVGWVGEARLHSTVWRDARAEQGRANPRALRCCKLAVRARPHSCPGLGTRIHPFTRPFPHAPHGPQATKEKVEALLRIAELKAAAEGTGVGRGDSAEDGVAAAASPAAAAHSPKGAHPAAKVADKAAAAERKGWFGSPLRG